MKTKEFNRSTVKEIADRIQSSLASVAEEFGIELNVNGGKFDAGKFTLKLDGILTSEGGVIVAPEGKHSMADYEFTSKKVSLVGHAIGSMWNIRGEIYTVIDFVAKRPKYPFQLKRVDGRLSKCAIGFLSQGTQMVKPTESEFITWFTVDPDSDAVVESDVEICDRVNDYLSLTLDELGCDRLFNLVDSMNEKFKGKKLENYAKESYRILFHESEGALKGVNLYLSSLINKRK